MGRQVGILKLKGSLGGISFYESQGEYLVKVSKGPDKMKIRTGSSYQRMRENMTEFGGASKAGTVLRRAFTAVLRVTGEPYLTGRLTALMKQVISCGVGEKGKRLLDVKLNKKICEGFEFNKKETFCSVFNAPLKPILFSEDRNKAHLLILGFSPKQLVNAREGSTHFQLFLAAGLLSDYFYDNKLKSYVPKDNSLNGKNKISFSEPISVCEHTERDILLSIDFNFGNILSEKVSVIAVSGILFYQEVNSMLYEVKQGGCMMISGVG